MWVRLERCWSTWEWDVCNTCFYPECWCGGAAQVIGHLRFHINIRLNWNTNTEAVYKKGKKVTFFLCVPHVFSMTAGIGEARIDGRFLVTLVINHQSSLLSFLAHSMTCRVDNEDMDIINKTWILIENTLVVALINCLWMKACVKCF